MTRTSALKLILAAVLVAVSLWLWLRPRTIEVAQADVIAKAMAVRYAATTGEPVSHFGRARRFTWPDGWEFVWSYRPCVADTALRVFVPVTGRAARITEAPDCTRLLGVPPVSA